MFSRDTKGRVTASMTAEQVENAFQRWRAGESGHSIARSCGIPVSTMQKHLAAHPEFQATKQRMAAERNAVIRSLWGNESIPLTEIGRRVGVSKSAVTDIARNLGLPPRKLPRSLRDALGRSRSKLTTEQIAAAFTRWANGEEIAELATEHGVRYEVMRRAFRRTSAFEAVAKRRKVDHSPWAARDAQIRAKRAEGKTRTQIAEEMGLSSWQVKDRLAVIDAPRPVVPQEERIRRTKEKQRLQDAQRTQKRREEREAAGIAPPRKPAFKTVAPRPAPIPTTAKEVPFPPRKPGTVYPPVPRTWARIREIAAGEYRVVNGMADLVNWNKARIARGDAPICVSDWNREKAA